MNPLDIPITDILATFTLMIAASILTYKKKGESSAVIEALKPFQEPESLPDKMAVVRSAYRYLFNRPNRLDYQGAIAIFR